MKLGRFTAFLLTMVLLSACGQRSEAVSEISATQPPLSTSASQSESSKAVAIPEESSMPPESTSVSQSEPSAVSATPAPQPWWKSDLVPAAFTSDSFGESNGEVNYYDNSNKISHRADTEFARNKEEYYTFTLITDTAKEVSDIGKPLPGGNFFELVTTDDTKYTGTLYEKGIALTKALPNTDKGEPVLLAIDEKDYKQICDNLTTLTTGEKVLAFPAWLSMMRRSRFSTMTVTGSNESDTVTYSLDAEAKEGDTLPWQARDMYNSLKGVTVKPYSTSVPNDTVLPGAAKVRMEFTNGTVYNIQADDGKILIAASGMDTALQYEIIKTGRLKKELDKWATGHMNPITAKPVIYLYPERPTDCTVKLDYDRFTYTYPAYSNGWNVTAYPDGRLVNKADNSEYYYLFWEGDKQVDWRFDSGFVVKGSDTESFLREKLAYMGLTPREYNDFITYWVPKLHSSPYNLITFAGEQYEAVAPLTVTPKPDSILRVHMVYKPIDKPMEIPEQTLHSFARTGFTVVEWGGTLAD